MTIKGIIFDFDGLICDTETPELRAWEKLFSDYGFVFPFEKYQETIGAVHNDETPFIFLEEMLNHPIDRGGIKEEFTSFRNKLIDHEPIRPGILNYLRLSNKFELEIGLASSSPRSWIDYHLNRLSIQDYFGCIKTFNDVSKTKPDPELFLKALACMNLKPNEVVALEDSINGVTAAKQAGIYVVVFPNEVTKFFEFDEADLVVDSLKEMPLDKLLKVFNNV
ncbi:MAG: HAD-IA family hydrolase [Anaerolineaceae bacterium]|nr:HAD-IA family hydrolase [Anaerolineaceae bacterium]